MITDHEDTYFVDRFRALRIALQQNRVRLESGEEAMQLCYYDGEPLAGAPTNLINVPLPHLIEFFLEYPLRLPTRLACDGADLEPELREQLEQAFGDALVDIRTHRAELNEEGGEQFAEDTYFLERGVAYQCALLQQTVDLGHRSVYGRQVCYYNGEPFQEGPDNLIPLPIDNLIAVLATTRYRRPTRIAFPAGAELSQRQELEKGFRSIQQQVTTARQQLIQHLVSECRQVQVDDFDAPLRIFLPASRVTEVMQYSSKGLANAFAQLGHQPVVAIERNDLEGVDLVNRLQSFREHRPHLVVNINHQNNIYLHESVFNAVWYQDPMPAIVQNMNMLPWRERDMVYSFSPQLDDYIRQTNPSEIRRQRFCIDGDVFRERPEVGREEKIVFLGGAYAPRLTGRPEERALVARLESLFAQGSPISRLQIEQLGREYGIDSLEAFWNIYHYVVRDTTVRWVCEVSPIPVEVYGQGWELYDEVRPFFRGRVAHGEQVARIYNSAKYALVSHPFEVHSQRLAEASGCGCMPIVYDCRHATDAPFWDDHCLFFRTRDELRACIGQEPQERPQAIAEASTYKVFAEQLVARVRSLSD